MSPSRASLKSQPNVSDEWLSRVLSIKPELANQLNHWIDEQFPPYPAMVPDFWDPSISTIHYIPVESGSIRVIHYCPSYPKSKRPVVFIPGWGVIPQGFRDLFEIFYLQVEFYYIETREKSSSRIHKYNSNFSMHQMAQDVGKVLIRLGLWNQDFVLMGGCWGSSVILQGLLDGTIDAPTIALFDPMHRLQYPSWILKIAHRIPLWFLWMLKPVLKWVKIRKLTQPKQRQRTIAFIKSAVLWKWRKAAHDVRNFELFDTIENIPHPVLIFSGTGDVIHDQRNYPLLAKQMSLGRYFYVQIDESRRESLMALVGLEFCQMLRNEGIPKKFQNYEKDLS